LDSTTGAYVTQRDSPNSGSIGLPGLPGLPGLIRWLIVVAGVIAVGAAFVAGSYALGIVGVVFFACASGLGYWARRAR
jgi:hypothetical protein